MCLNEAGEYQEAGLIYKRVYQERVETQGEEHRETLDALNSLAAWHFAVGHYNEVRMCG